MVEPRIHSARKLSVIDHLAGVAAQFQHRKDGYVYQQDRIGAPIPVTPQEREAFLSAAARALLLHLAGFGLCMVAAGLLVRRVAGDDEVLTSALFTFAACAVAWILYASFRAASLAPARALAERTPIGPAGEPRLPGNCRYRMIFGVAAFLMIWVVVFTSRGGVYSAGAGVSIVMGALFMAVRKWRFEHRLNPAQRAKEKASLAADRARDRANARPGRALVVLLFAIVEVIVFGVVLYLTIALVLDATGSSMTDPDGWSFALGFLLGGAAGWIAVTPLERLCKWLTGTTASNEFDFLVHLP